jgi:hypothetical protein
MTDPSIQGEDRKTLETSEVILRGSPLSLEGLLRPGYDPGQGVMDGSQLVDGKWFDPALGCDSLQCVIDNLRSRGYVI